MIKNCEECNKQFEGHRNAHYCQECRLKLQREAHKRYNAKHPERVKARMQAYYAKNREKLVAKQRAYNAAVGHKPRLPKFDTAGWTIEFKRNGDLWTWSAKKGNVVLDAGRDFSTLRIAQKDCLLAIG